MTTKEFSSILFKTYYTLAKPGIVYGNALPAIAGFMLASKGQGDFWRLLATVAGISLVIACGCVLNNYVDRGIDKRMARTKHRALATGEISGRSALIYGVVLGAAGFGLLLAYTNWLTVSIGLAALFLYVVAYGYAKRHSVHGTLVGTLPGAAAPLAGYTAVSNHIDLAAALLFLILVFWQLPHFYAIALFRARDYAAAGLPVLAVKRGTSTSKRYILGYMVAFLVAALALGVAGYTGYAYLLVVGLLGLVWLGQGIRGWRAPDSAAWARKIFFSSLIVLTVLCTMIVIDPVLP